MHNLATRIILALAAVFVLLLISACRTEPDQPTPLPTPELSPTPQPEVILEVQTNFDILTPFVPQYTLHTRLNEGVMPELIPSDGYGMLLPYSSAVIMDDGNMIVSKFGLVTIDGVVVTDLIYDEVERARYIHSWYIGEADDVLPAYSLTTNILDIQTDPMWGDSISINRKMAVCALDGSWITSFDYEEIAYTKDVILLYRDASIFDIDVIDYDGKHLYNMRDLSWSSNAIDEVWAGINFNIISDRYAHVRMRNNTYAFINLLTGRAQSTRYIAVDPFVEGFAPAGVGIANTYYVAWGLINSNFETVVSPRYYSMPFFLHGRAIVQLRDNSQVVINTRGDVLFNVPAGYRLDHSFDGPTFIMYNEFGSFNDRVYLTSEFEEIVPPKGSGSTEIVYMRYLSNGWHTTESDEGAYLFKGNEVHFFKDVRHIMFFDGELISYIKICVDRNELLSGVMSLFGEDIMQPEPYATIIPVIQNDVTAAFIISTTSMQFFSGQYYVSAMYWLVDIYGNLLIQGRGVLEYHNDFEMYSIQSGNGFSWLDNNAVPVITIPFLSSAFD